MENQVKWLFADEHVDKYKADPIEAANKLAEIWCSTKAESVDVWGCDWPCQEFFETFLDYCREHGCLKEALGIWWMVHNCPGSETDPCFSETVHQWVIDYSKKYGLESETLKIKDRGLDKFKLLDELKELHPSKRTVFGCYLEKLAYIYPNPKDENGRFIPMTEINGQVVPWPKHPDGSFMKMDEF